MSQTLLLLDYEPRTVARVTESLLPIGSELVTAKDVDAVTLADCRRYYKSFFVPQRLTLVLAGAIDGHRLQLAGLRAGSSAAALGSEPDESKPDQACRS